jgi:hypothetical protein
MILKIFFAEKFREKNGVLDSKILPVYAKNDHDIGYQGKRQFFA